MIEKVLEKWHQFVIGELNEDLEELLADDVEFYSPVVFTPQKGKAITKMYLTAAAVTFSAGKKASTDSGVSNFKYVKQVIAGNQAVLEFESEIDGKFVNGVDIISCNDEGKITEFKVMLRPLQAVNAMHQAMKMMLETM